MNETRQTTVGIYCRSSSIGQRTSIDIQKSDLMEFADRKGWKVFKVYVDDGISGIKTASDRPALQQLLQDAREGRFQIVAVWKLDRLFRSISSFLDLAETLKQLSIGLVSFKEGIDTSNDSITSKVFLVILGLLADIERSAIKERCAAGIQRSREKGMKWGRPKKKWDEEMAVRLKQEGMSLREIGQRLGVSHATVAGAVKKTPKSLAS